jgi:hypothetical protein
MSQTLDLSSDSKADSDDESVDSQATIIDKNPLFNPIIFIDCAKLIEPHRNIVRLMGIFEYQGKGRTAFYKTSGKSRSAIFRDAYVPFYGETNKLIKPNQVNPDIKNKDWKIALKPYCNFSHKILDFFEDFYEFQISASINSTFWNRSHYRSFILSHDFNEHTGEFIPLPEPIPSSDNFSEMGCNRDIIMETGEINDFLRRCGARIAEREIEAYQLQEQEAKEAERLAEMSALHQVQLEEEKEPPGSLKLDKGGRSLKKRRKTRKSKKTKKTKKSKKSKKYYSINN